jgi:hypothetical protein
MDVEDRSAIITTANRAAGTGAPWCGQSAYHNNQPSGNGLPELVPVHQLYSKVQIRRPQLTHAGIPWLRFIRQRLGERVHFWPFDGWHIPVGLSAIAEVYPRLCSRDFAPENRIGDQHDAYSIAAWLRRADHDGSLATFLKPVLTPPERTVAQVEGWILGVQGLIREPILDQDQTRH